MTSPRPTIAAGGEPTPAQAAALAAALATLLDAEAAGAAAPALPAPYRSAWRAAAIREAAGLPRREV